MAFVSSQDRALHPSSSLLQNGLPPRSSSLASSTNHTPPIRILPEIPTIVVQSQKSVQEPSTPSEPKLSPVKSLYGHLKRKPVPRIDDPPSPQSHSSPSSPQRVVTLNSSSSSPSSPPLHSTSIYHNTKVHLRSPSSPGAPLSSPTSSPSPPSISPIKSNTVLNTAKSSKPSRTHFRSGSTSDGSTALPVDLKRLLSKPALPTPSGPVYSVPSDDGSSGGGGRGDREVPTRYTLDIPRSNPTPPSAPTLAPRTRNVLRRRPSANKTPDGASRHGSAPVAPTNSVNAASSSGNGGVSLSIPSSPLSSPTPIYNAYRSAQNLTVSARTTNSSNKQLPSVSLTPAGEVAQAYMQQEERRSGAASHSNNRSRVKEDGVKVRPREKPPPMAETPSPSPSPSSGPSPMPYYTVLGSMRGTVVAVGSPEDDTFDVIGGQFGAGSGQNKKESEKEKEKHSRLVKAPIGPRTLSRKISGKWRKATCKGESPPPPAVVSTLSAGSDLTHISNSANSSMRSLHDNRTVESNNGSSTGDRKWRRSLSLSLVDGEGDASPATHATKSLPTIPPSHVEVVGDAFPGTETGASAPRRAQSELVASGKIWRLMKRISAGGMREKYHHNQQQQQQEQPALPPPPLPPLPASAIPKRHRSEGQQQPHQQRGGGVFSKLLHHRNSMSPSRKPSALARSSKGGGLSASAPTRSSSPGSSDVASSKFFYHQQSHSTRSSSSSYGEDLHHHPPPPVPNTTLIDQHIIPPRELNRLDYAREEGTDSTDHRTESPKPRPPALPPHMQLRTLLQNSLDDYRVIDTPEDEHPPSLPFPPPRARRRTAPEAGKDGGKEGSGLKKSQSLEKFVSSPSPTIPSFSTSGAINTFGSRRSTSRTGTETATLRAVEMDWEGSDDGGVGRNSSSGGVSQPKESPPPISISTSGTTHRPPPRPTKSGKRSATSTSDAHASSSGPRSAPAVERSPNPISGPGADEPERRSRSSTSGARSSFASTVRPSARQRSSSLNSSSTLRLKRREAPVPLPAPVSASPSVPPSSLSPSASPRNARSPQTPVALTEQEKADKWDDLLARSARAGGTLHLGSSVLVSDLVRLSSASEFSIDLDAYT